MSTTDSDPVIRKHGLFFQLVKFRVNIPKSKMKLITMTCDLPSIYMYLYLLKTELQLGGLHQFDERFKFVKSFLMMIHSRCMYIDANNVSAIVNLKI